MIDEHLLSVNLPVSNSLENGPRIEIVSNHLESWDIVRFYKSCDSFVLPTHGEGWGLPTHEAMVMGLPVITTNWGGSTEFVKSEGGLLIDVIDLIPTLGDDWLYGHNWAKIDLNKLQYQMRYLFQNKEDGKLLGKKGQEYIKKYDMNNVANIYANR